MPEVQPIRGSMPWPVTASTAALVSSLARYLADVPQIPDAACRGAEWLADVGHQDPPKRIEAAKSVCRGCVERPRCEQWLLSLPPARRPAGVVAGHLAGNARPSRAKKVTAAPRPAKPARPTAEQTAEEATAWLRGRLALRDRRRRHWVHLGRRGLLRPGLPVHSLSRAPTEAPGGARADPAQRCRAVRTGNSGRRCCGAPQGSPITTF
jgi:hypothetical protein